MAVGKSGYIDVVVMPQSVGKVRVYWQEDYDAINNYSTITITDIQGYLWHRNGWADLTLTVTAGDVVIMNDNTDWMLACLADTTLRSVVPRTQWDGTFTPITSAPIYHNEDGTKTVTITFTLVDIIISSVGFNGANNESASVTVALTSIPRASTISATDANIEAVSSVVVNRKSSAYTHSIQYQFGNISGYISADGGVSSSEVKLTATNIGFTIPTSFYAQIPNAKTGICTLTVKTYSGDTQIGDAKSCTFVCTASQSLCTPAVSGTVVDVNENTIALTGDENKLVRFYSHALATIESSAKNAASIVSNYIAGTEVEESSKIIQSVEANSFEFSTTDSRGYSNSVTIEKTIIEYIKLTTNVTVGRDDSTSGRATLNVVGQYFNDSFGAVTNELLVKYRINGGQWVQVTPVIDNNTYTVTVNLTDMNYQSEFDFDVIVSDKITSLTKSATLSRGVANFHMGRDDLTVEVLLKANGGLSLSNLRILGKQLWRYIMPAGYVYVSTNPTSPAELFGPSWQSIEFVEGFYAWERLNETTAVAGIAVAGLAIAGKDD